MKPKQSPKLGFLVTYGTDTMSWGLSAIRYMLKNLPANVAITGSQVPLSFLYSSSDVYPNVENSIKLLTQLTGPEIFVVFNNGQAAFQDALWKFDKWSPDAFKGEELARITLDEIIIHGRAYPMILNRKLDKLYLIRTGGTIDSEFSDDGVLVPRGNLVVDFIKQRFTDFYKEFEPISVMAVDSSEMVLKSWIDISKCIAQECNNAGYTTFCDDKFNSNIQIVATSPMMREEEYYEIFTRADGIILNAYGSGTINADLKSGYSPLPAIEKAIADGKYIVIASHTPVGTQDFIYQNSWEPIKKGAIPAGDFSIAHCQIKLSYILGHIKEIQNLSNKTKIPIDALVKIAFLSGVDFRSNSSRMKFEQLIGYQIPLKDPFFNLPFAVALQKIERFLNKKEKQKIIIDSLDKFEEVFDKYFSDPKIRNKWAIILKPDTVIGANQWGELIDASENFATITSELLDWNIIALELSEINYQALLEKIKSLSSNNESIGEFFRTFRYVIIEGGRQSLYDSQSFDDISNGNFTKENYLHLLRSLMSARNISGANPALYLCLGHQGYAEMLRDYLVTIINDSQKIAEKIRLKDEKVANQFLKIISDIKSMDGKIIVKRRNQEIVAEKLADQFFAVKQNEMPEIGLKRVIEYKPSKDIVPDEILKVYQRNAKLHTGLLEDFYSLESLDIVMLHGDEVNEEAILFINWILNLFSKFIRMNYTILESIHGLSEFISLPVGLEIPSSTDYSMAEKSTLTEIAGFVIYYYNPIQEIIKRDYTLQFHPELFEELRIMQKRDFESKTLLDLSDGIKLLLSCLQAGFIETTKKF